MIDYENYAQWRDRKVEGYGAEAPESGTVPGATNNYTVLLNERIVKNGTLIITCDGDPLTVVPWGTAPGVDQASVCYDLPLVKVNSAREAQELIVDYTRGGGVLSSSKFKEIEELAASGIADSEKGAPNGVATLDSGGKVPSSQLPGLALTDVTVVASQVAQLALTVQEGDLVVRSDENKSYVHNGGTAGTMADWTEIKSTVAIANVTGLQTALDGKQAIAANLTAIAALAANGLITRTGSGTTSVRTIAVGTDLSISNADGVSGNPTISLGSNVAKKNTDNAFSAAQTFGSRIIISGGIKTSTRSIDSNTTLQPTDYHATISLGTTSPVVDLNTVNIEIGQVFMWEYFNQGGNLGAGRNVTFDAGTGNNIAGNGVFAQTYVGATSSGSRWFEGRKINSTTWTISSGVIE